MAGKVRLHGKTAASAQARPNGQVSAGSVCSGEIEWPVAQKF